MRSVRAMKLNNCIETQLIVEQKLDVSQLTVFFFESSHQFEEQKHLGDNTIQLRQCVLN